MNFLDTSFDADDSTDINLTPLIDIVFILLIFFMVTTTFDERSGLKVELPTTEKQTSSDVESSLLTLTVTKDGKTIANNATLTRTERQSLLASHAKNKGPAAAVYIRADKSSSHGDVVRIMDEAQQAGISKIGIATTPTAR